MSAAPRPPSGWLLGALGTLVFLNVYAPQSLLPVLAREFHAGAAQVGVVVGATMLAMALASPLVGVLADALGRRRTVVGAFALLAVPALLAAHAPTLDALNAARFAQGLLIPGVMVALTAYIGEEIPAAARARAMTMYVTGTVLGGFLGRFLAGVIDARFGWHAAFWGLAGCAVVGFLLALTGLPRERAFRPSRDPRAVLAGLVTHLHTPALLATCAVGCLILFTLVGTFNTLTLRLAAPPYDLNSAQTGAIFAVYLLGVVITPVAGPLLATRGPRFALLTAVGASVTGLLLTLTPALPLIVAGVAAGACGVFLAQSAALAAVQRAVTQARSLASGLYHASYYGGAAVASVVAGHVFEAGGWPGVVPLVVLSMALAGVVGVLGWKRT
ncbi:putative MFS family arabinose efflux permease [Deinococcus metalli]|uniref:MFS transporter n=1 Tax=Deinococcus metalli TaxID=1141878 RepID=A0A7W8NQF2_9DEIO|nr:MFS transporter [Deinococcus metalli]MBB5376730.1 putative MFS family arabinose efflux permease [Deinococcus metalli]GHF44910.1 MFS transporter [Deinococcus metalli]